MDVDSPRWTRRQQLRVVSLTHLSVLGFVLLVLTMFDVPGDGSPKLFYVQEVAIILLCGWPLIDWKSVSEDFRKVLPLPAPRREADPKLAERRREERLETFARYALLIAFGLQLGALVPLLDVTGGPIDSPFAQMAVALAVFTPYLATNPLTVIFVGVTIAAYYFLLVGMLDDLSTRGPYLTVNLSILAISVLLSYGDLLRRAESG